MGTDVERQIDLKFEDVERAAKLMAANVSMEEIANVLSLSLADFQELTLDEGFLELYHKAKAAKVEQEISLDENWDSVELNSIRALSEIVKWNRDPNLLMRVAAIANKASRRKSDHNKPIVPREGVQVSLHFAPSFSMQQPPLTLEEQPVVLEQKVVDVMPLKALQDAAKEITTAEEDLPMALELANVAG